MRLQNYGGAEKKVTGIWRDRCKLFFDVRGKEKKERVLKK